jgi:hypothetical protein
LAVLHRNGRCVSKIAILLGRVDLGVSEKSKSSIISKGLRCALSGRRRIGNEQ